MKSLFNLFAFAAVCLFAVGCSNETTTSSNTPAAGAGTTNVSATLENDLCAKCGCCADCGDCCKGAKCGECGMQKGTELCCSGVKPADAGKYCKDCGFVKGTEKCCAEGNTKCGKCGLAAGSDLCCKVAAHSDHAGHDHDDADHAH